MDENEESLRRSVMFLRWQLEAMPRNDPERADRVAEMAAALARLFERTTEISVLREAIAAFRAAAEVHESRYHEDLRQLLSRLFLATTEFDPRLLKQALSALYPSAPEDTAPAAGLPELVTALRREYELTDDLPTLRDAVAAARLLVKFTRVDDPRSGARQVELATVLWQVSGRDGDLALLDEALRITRAASPDADRSNLLALILKRRYELTGDVDALREAVEFGREADSYQGNLADALRVLAERTSDLAMAREAVALARQAIGGLRADDAEWAQTQAVLGGALTHLASRTNDTPTAAEAVRESRKAVVVTPVHHPAYLTRLTMLYRGLMLQYDTAPEQTVLDEALAVARDLVGTAPKDHPDRGKHLSYLSRALRAVFLRGNGNSVLDLKESTEYARQAVAGTPPNHPDRAINLADLADLLQLMHERTHDRVSLREFLTTNTAIAKMSAAPVDQRIEAARRAAQADLSLGRQRHALTMIRLATDLLPQLGLRDVDRADREHRVAAAHKLPATAAAVAVAAGQPGLAVELLEQTRGVVFAGTLDTREDVVELRQAAPELLDRFDLLREEINAADHEITSPSFGEHRDTTGRHPRELATRRADLSRDWDELLAEIRQQPGLAGFQRPTPVAELRTHADQGPIVSVVADESGHALILRDESDGTDEPVLVVDLPAVTRANVVQQTEVFRTALGVALDREQPVRARRTAQARLREVLAWTWDTITEPVLEGLGRTGPPAAGEPWPRVWWCPVGVVTTLPLHASGRDTDSVVDRVISSYTPTIRALAHARRDGPPKPSTSVVTVPDAPQSPPLPGATQEAELVCERILGAAVLSTATRATVLDALREHGIVHLACHGYADLRDPSASRLLLPDHLTDPLTLHTITRLNLRHAQLAYLSACSTTDTNQEHADEATHLTAAFQLAGYRNVIGTLWPINDQTAIDVAKDFYTDLTAGGSAPPDPARSALALHHAVRVLRDAAPALPSRWAAYLHSGA